MLGQLSLFFTTRSFGHTDCKSVDWSIPPACVERSDWSGENSVVGRIRLIIILLVEG